MVKQFSFIKLALALAITLQFFSTYSSYYPESYWINAYEETCESKKCKKRLKKLFEIENKFYTELQKNKKEKRLLKLITLFIGTKYYRSKLIPSFYYQTEEEHPQKTQANKLYEFSPFPLKDLLGVINRLENDIETNS